MNPIKAITLILLGGMAIATNALSASSFNLSIDSGGSGGSPFVDMAAPGEKISQITIRSGKYIDSIQLHYRYKTVTSGNSHGGNGGQSKTFILKKNEYITELGGKSGKFVDSIYIKTNKGRNYKWGGNGGAKSFKFVGTKKSPIKGIWGRAGKFLDAIGVVRVGTTKSHYPSGSASKGKLNKFSFSTNSGGAVDCDKCDSAPSNTFPVPSAAKPAIDYWLKTQNSKLKKILQSLAGSGYEFTSYLNKENGFCRTNLYCEIDTRSNAITHVRGIK
ncbi:MAG: hypothetical protein GY781_01335 [Gammaproteobacteria bacterium]|nr:hypothetical protein [Gammaproteobacteria bacterium]